MGSHACKKQQPQPVLWSGTQEFTLFMIDRSSGLFTVHLSPQRKCPLYVLIHITSCHEWVLLIVFWCVFSGDVRIGKDCMATIFDGSRTHCCAEGFFFFFSFSFFKFFCFCFFGPVHILPIFVGLLRRLGSHSKLHPLNGYLRKVDVGTFTHASLGFPFHFFCSKLLESVRMVACVVWVSPLEAIQWWMSAFTSTVSILRLRPCFLSWLSSDS